MKVPTQDFLNTLRSRLSADAAQMAGWVNRTSCGLGGHVMVRHFEPNRMSLQCLSCGHQTPGWTVQGRA